MKRALLGVGAVVLAAFYAAACGADDEAANVEATDAGTAPEGGGTDGASDAPPADANRDVAVGADAGCSPKIVPVAFPLTGPQLARTPNGYAVASRVGASFLGPPATITVQLLDANGARMGAVTDNAGSSRWQHDLVWAKNQLLLAWGPGGGPNSERLKIRRFDANAQPLGAEIPVFPIAGSGLAPTDIRLVAAGNIVGWIGTKDPPGTLYGIIRADDGSYRGPLFRGVANGGRYGLTTNGTSFAFTSEKGATLEPRIVPFDLDGGSLAEITTTAYGGLGFDGTSYVVFSPDAATQRMIERRIDPTTGASTGAAQDLDPTAIAAGEYSSAYGPRSIVNGPNGHVAIAYVSGGTLRVIEVDAARKVRTVMTRPAVVADASSDVAQTFDIDYDGDRIVLVTSGDQTAELVFGCPGP
jgi:hypothetical protein